MDFDFSSYKQLVPFLGACFGENTEVVLYDFQDLNHAVIAIHNGHISGRDIGAPVTGYMMSKLKDKGTDQPPYYLGYRSVDANKRSLKSNSFFILGTDGRPVGMLSINMDVHAYEEAAKLLQNLAMLPLEPLEVADAHLTASFDTITSSPRDMILDMCQQEIGDGVDIDRLTTDEKIQIFRRLNDEKFFLIKGAVSEAAQVLQVSIPTAYRYISKINKEENK